MKKKSTILYLLSLATALTAIGFGINATISLGNTIPSSFAEFPTEYWHSIAVSVILFFVTTTLYIIYEKVKKREQIWK